MTKTIEQEHAADVVKAAAPPVPYDPADHDGLVAEDGDPNYGKANEPIAGPPPDDPEPPNHDVPEGNVIDSDVHSVKSVRPCVAGDQWFNPETPSYVVTFTTGLRSAYPHG